MKKFQSINTFFVRSEAIGSSIVKPFQSFASLETTGGLLMILATILALLWMNSSWAPLYDKLWHTKIVVGVGQSLFDQTLHFWINEGLMAFFFLVVGLEIKRELLVGELASLRRAALPAAGAVGGVVLPALIYYYLNYGTPSAQGWGVPMATDIAFVLGALTLLGSRVPSTLAIFLVSLAIVDDLCAVVVIALFYSGEIYTSYLLLAGTFMLALVLLNILGLRRPLPYILVGIVIWFLVFMSGLHATVAGIFLAMVIPARSDFDTGSFAEGATRVLEEFRVQDERVYVNELHGENQAVIRGLEEMCLRVEPPLQRLEYLLHPWVTFSILPLFALANAGVKLDQALLVESVTSLQSLGIILGLVVGKQIGIFAAAWLAVKVGLAELPPGVGFKHVYGGSILCGIGFTMSLFIAKLSFSQPQMLNTAKISILFASLICGIAGTLVLYFLPGPGDPKRESL
jgi:Na+:H+ antiporter, NhaA family